jgi:hypothetical protein
LDPPAASATGPAATAAATAVAAAGAVANIPLGKSQGGRPLDAGAHNKLKAQLESGSSQFSFKR